MYKVCDNLNERKQKQIQSDQRFIKVIAVIAMIVSIIVALNTYVFMSVIVEGGSMNPTLQSGDVLVANVLREHKKGDMVVIIDQKGKDELIIKRVIATEGDFVEIVNGTVYVNDKKLKEDYVINGYFDEQDDYPYTKIEKGEVFYLGDNRANSRDSRTYGTCKDEQIVGVVEEWSLTMRWLNKIIYDVGLFLRGEI